MSNKIFVPVERFYLYVTTAIFPKEALRSVVYNIGVKGNYDKFAKRLKRIIKYLPPELEIEIRVRRADK